MKQSLWRGSLWSNQHFGVTGETALRVPNSLLASSSLGRGMLSANHLENLLEQA